MRILVLDVAASDSGALSILNQFYNDVAKKEHNSNEWFFLVSTPILESKKNIRVIRYPWIKKSWLHRLFFDYFYLKKIIRNNNIDMVFSLQNIIVKGICLPQILYLHQSLPFSKIRFNFIKNPKLWVYQNLISKKIFYSIKNADLTIVQTNWMRKEIGEKGFNIDKIAVIPPNIIFKKTVFSKNTYSNNKFIYPATPFFYKNHHLIVEACKKLKSAGINDYIVYFTLSRDHDEYSKQLFEEIQNNHLNIFFVGLLSTDQLVQKYNECTLLFPSFIETFGLPLLEARVHNSIILASDMEFSREVLAEYNNAYFYEYNNSIKLASYMKSVLNGDIKRNDNIFFSYKTKKLIDEVIDFMDNV